MPTLIVLSAASNAAGPGAGIFWRDGIVLEVEGADVHLGVDDVPAKLVGGVAPVGGEEDVALGSLDVGAPPEHRDHPGDVAVADVVLAAVGAEPLAPAARRLAPCVGREDHVGLVDVGAVLPLGEAEGEHGPVIEEPGGALAGGAVVGLPDRPEPEDRDLPRIPVGEPVEAEDLVEGGVAPRVPTLVGVTASVAGRREQGCERPLAPEELDEVAVPLVAARLGHDRDLALGLEPVNGGAEKPPASRRRTPRRRRSPD